MRQSFLKNLPRSVWSVFLLLVILQVVNFVVVRFVHYTSQYRNLEPHTYQVQVITPEDYAKLGDKSLESVSLSDGSTISDRQPVFYERSLPNYKRVNDHYVLVTTIGTSHYFFRWFSDMFPIMFFTVIGLVLATLHLRHQTLEHGNQAGENQEHTAAH